jgi:hypothetical protein
MQPQSPQQRGFQQQADPRYRQQMPQAPGAGTQQVDELHRAWNHPDRDPRTLDRDPRGMQRGPVDPRNPSARSGQYPANSQANPAYRGQLASPRTGAQQPLQRQAGQTPSANPRRRPIVIQSTPGGRSSSGQRATGDPATRMHGAEHGASRAGQIFGGTGSGRGSIGMGAMGAAPGHRR